MTFPPAPRDEEPAARTDSPSLLGWMRWAPVERATLPAAAAVWLAAVILHAAAVSPLYPALAGLAAAWWAYRHVSRRQRLAAKAVKHRKMKRNHPVDAAGTVLVTTGWAAAAVKFGPFAGPAPVLSLAWLLITVGGYWWLRGHEGVRHAREWRHRKMAWLGEAHALGLGGAHMLDHSPTRLGEEFELDTTGTGQLASAIVASSLAERIAQRRQFPVTRVKVAKGPIAGRVKVNIRDRDPWAKPVLHPLLDPDPEIALPVPCSIRTPAIVGMDPETGDPLALPLRDDGGGKRILVMGTSRWAGKSVLLSDIRERVTAAPDALVIGINLSKAIEDAAWAPACHLTAIGPDQAQRARQIMNLLVRIIAVRPQLRDTATHQPSPASPHIVLAVDEADTAVGYIRDQLGKVSSKGSSEGVTLIEAGQRGTADWLGGGNIRALFDVFCIGMVSREMEAIHAAGNLGLIMPDMSSYGEGHRGVWAVAELGSSPVTGRSFLLAEPPDLRRIAHSRAHRQPVLEPELVEALGGRYADLYAELLSTDVFAQWARTDEGQASRDADSPRDPEEENDTTTTGSSESVTVTLPAGPSPEPPVPGPDDLEKLLEGDVPDDFPVNDPAARAAHMRHRNAATRRMNDESDRIEAALPKADPAKLTAMSAQRWDDAIAQTPLPDDAREKLMRLLAGEGTTVRKAAGELGVARWTAHLWLKRLAREGAARLDGRGRASRWRTANAERSDAP